MFMEMVDAPATSLVITFCTLFWIYISHKRLGYEQLGMSYNSVVLDGEYWRLLVSQISHVELLHLVFNMSSLWSLGFVERDSSMGTAYYIKVTLLLLLFSELVCLGIYFFAIKVLRREYYNRVVAVGYSCVVFGWMSNLSVAPGAAAKYSILGMAQIPMWTAPFGSLVITSILVPRASFLGHLSGILVGYVIGFGVFNELNLFWTLSLGGWAILGVVISLVRSGTITIPFVQVHASNDLESGNAVRIVDGVVVR